MNYINRAIAPVLKSRIKGSKCLLLTGARQIGKSTLLMHEFPNYNKVSFDDRLMRLQAKEEPKLFFLNNPCPLFIGEVQKENSILEDIKAKVDSMDERGLFILSGSQKLELMKGISESLVGRISITELAGLSLREIHGVDFNHHFIPTEDYITAREKTIKNWISILERTGIIYLLQPYSASALKRSIRSPKIYFRDTGFACYLTRWLTPETLKVSAVAGNMFETFVVSEILKSYSNEGLDYRFSIFYYRGKDKNVHGENEIDLVIEENGILYPVEIKMSGNPKASMGAANVVLDKVADKKRGMGVILCMVDKKTYLRENLVALPIEYI